MKKYICISIIISVFSLNADAQQLNKLLFPLTVNSGVNGGWYRDRTPDNYELKIDDNAVKIEMASGEASNSRQFIQRFEPTFGGEYVLTFAAKTNDTPQTISFSISRVDQGWGTLATTTAMNIDSDQYKEYAINFTNTAISNMPTTTCQLLCNLTNVTSDLWFKDIVLYEKNNSQAIYVDDFETDRYYAGMGYESTNGWWTPANGTLEKANINGNVVLQFTSAVEASKPWLEQQTNWLWNAKQGVQYRVKFDIGGSVNIPKDEVAETGVAMEIWNWSIPDRIRPIEYIPITTTMESVNFITKAAVETNAYSPNLYLGKVPVGEKLYIDNFLIEPIYLYNVEVSNVTKTGLDVSWLHSGYLTGDKLDIIFISGSETTIMSDVEVIAGTATVDLSSLSLTNGGSYTIKIKDKVGSGEYEVNNEASSESFEIYYFDTYTITSDLAPGTYPALSFPANVELASSLISGGTEINPTIVYTTDGSDPTTSSFAYSGPISLTGATTVKAALVKGGYIGDVFTFAFRKAYVWTPQNESTDFTDVTNWIKEGGASNPSSVSGIDVLIRSSITPFPTVSTNISVAGLMIEYGAQVNVAESCTVTADKVSVRYPIAENFNSGARLWNAVGFPFTVAEINCLENDAIPNWTSTSLAPHNPDVTAGNFWLKSYDGSANKFEYTQTMSANTGYIVQFPDGFLVEGTCPYTAVFESAVSSFAFTNAASVTLPTNNGEYRLVANPGLKEITVTDDVSTGIYYYKYYKTDNHFKQTNKAPSIIAPFEAFIVTKQEANTTPTLRSFSAFTDDETLTSIKTITKQNDPVIETRYYTLQGVAVNEPVGNGIYLVKKLHESGKVTTGKMLNVKNN